MADPTSGAPRRHDAYMEWGLASSFRYFFREQRARSGDGAIGLLIEWESPEAAKTARERCAQTLHATFSVADVYLGQRIWALSIPVSLVRLFLTVVAEFVVRIELASPVAGNGQRPILPLNIQSSSDTLSAVFDDGCAFANDRFMRAAKTRVLWLWNQDENAIGLSLEAAVGPSPRCDFGYGAQWPGEMLSQMIAVDQGRQAVIYDEAGLPGLRRATAHGPHVMDLAFGAEDWPIVFVQFPKSGIDDPSGRWLGRHVLDGLHYVVEAAGPATTRIVVNISWGPQTGPHDGSSLLECAIDQLIADLDTRSDRKTLIVTLPAGNSFSARSHAQVPHQLGGSVSWIVPPDSQAPAFLEVWWPHDATVGNAKLFVTPPGGTAEVEIRAGMPWVLKDWFADCSVQGRSMMALVVVNPSEDGDPNWRGRPGRWTIRLAAGAAGVSGDIHIYLARADHNMGARRRAKASYLVDAALDAARFVAPDQRYDEAPRSAIRREGTLNGIATGARTHVAAGYRLSDSRATPYSSSGPTRDGRDGPSYACVTDYSQALPGVRASGVRSGTTFRLVGTSTAAPQLARKLGSNLGTGPTKNPNNEPRVRVGDGLLEPDPRIIHDA